MIAGVAFKFAYFNRICFVLDYFITELFVYRVCGTEGCVQVGMFE
jgi:hypothetical protein